MPNKSEAQPDPEFEAFIHSILDAAARQCLPELFATKSPEALYHLTNRNGISITALRTQSLNQDQLVQIMRYRLAQYIVAHQVDPRMLYNARMEYEPLSNLTPDDVHIIAGSAETGEILCYGVIRSRTEAPDRATVRMQDRPLFPVEQVFGRGLYDRLRILPDLPVGKVRELGRFVKNQQVSALDELLTRAPVEVVAALSKLLTGPLGVEVEACIGDIEEGVAKKTMDFFHIPMVVIHGVLPYVAQDAFLWLRFQFRTCYPFAFLCADLSMRRLAAIEEALALPGKQGIMKLFELKLERDQRKSSLEPPGGLPRLAEAAVPQQDVAMQTRRQMIDVGDWLRKTDLFRGLSSAEATVLGTFMERRTVAFGEVIIRQGEMGDDLFVIQAGQAEVQISGRAGTPVRVNTMGPGDYFGEIALVMGGERTADVIALTPMTLLRLTKDAYTHYLAHLIDVEQQIMRMALSRSQTTLRSETSGDP